MADFPALVPTARDIQLGQFPTKTYRALSGATVRRSFGSKPFGHGLDLRFENILGATVASIIDHYHGQGGGTIGFALPETIFAGYNAYFRERLGNHQSSILWFYAEPPAIQSVIKNLSSVTVKLVGELR